MRQEIVKKIPGDLQSRLGFSEYSSKVNALDVAGKCVDLEMSAYQLSGDLSINFPENIDSKTREAVRLFNTDNSLRLHYHAPTDIPLASRHEPLRMGGINRLFEFIELAADMGAESFIFHPGRFAYYKIGSGKVVMSGITIPDIYFQRFYDSAKRLVDKSAGRLEILLENTYDFSEQLINIVDKFLELPSTGLVWDIGHMQRSMMLSQSRNIDPMPIAEFFSARIRKIRLAHLHDIDGTKGHLPLGTGKLKLQSHLEILSNLDIDMIIEVFSENDLKTSIKFIESITGDN